MGETLGNMCKDSSYCLNNEISKTEPKEEFSTDLYLKKKVKKNLILFQFQKESQVQFIR